MLPLPPPKGLSYPSCERIKATVASMTKSLLSTLFAVSSSFGVPFSPTPPLRLGRGTNAISRCKTCLNKRTISSLLYILFGAAPRPYLDS